MISNDRNLSSTNIESSLQQTMIHICISPGGLAVLLHSFPHGRVGSLDKNRDINAQGAIFLLRLPWELDRRAPVRAWTTRMTFQWGVAGAAYQIEGAHDADGKARSIWDDFCKVPGAIDDGTSAEVACDFYHRCLKDEIHTRRG